MDGPQGLFYETPMTEIAEAPRPKGLRRLYAWMMENARGRHAWAALAAFAFAEASFFPIPPDVMLLPMMLANRRRALAVAAWCTFWSVMGACWAMRSARCSGIRPACG